MDGSHSTVGSVQVHSLGHGCTLSQENLFNVKSYLQYHLQIYEWHVGTAVVGGKVVGAAVVLLGGV